MLDTPSLNTVQSEGLVVAYRTKDVKSEIFVYVSSAVTIAAREIPSRVTPCFIFRLAGSSFI